MVRTIAEAMTIFVVSILILGFVAIIPQVNTHNAAGQWWLVAKGPVLMLVGVLYIACGAFLLTWKR